MNLSYQNGIQSHANCFQQPLFPNSIEEEEGGEGEEPESESRQGSQKITLETNSAPETASLGKGDQDFGAFTIGISILFTPTQLKRFF